MKAGQDRTGRDDWDAAECPPPYWPGRRGEMKMTGVSLPGAWGHPPLDTLDTVKTPLLVNHVSIFRLAGLALCKYKNKTYTDNSSPTSQPGQLYYDRVLSNENCEEVILRNTMRLLP